MAFNRLAAISKRSAVVLTIAAACVFAGGTAAHAGPTGCSTYVGLDHATYYCSGGTGSYRIGVECFDPFGNTYYWRSSSWWKPGTTAFAWCDEIWHFTTGNVSLWQRK